MVLRILAPEVQLTVLTNPMFPGVSFCDMMDTPLDIHSNARELYETVSQSG